MTSRKNTRLGELLANLLAWLASQFDENGEVAGSAGRKVFCVTRLESRKRT